MALGVKIRIRTIVKPRLRKILCLMRMVVLRGVVLIAKGLRLVDARSLTLRGRGVLHCVFLLNQNKFLIELYINFLNHFQ